MVGGKMYIVMNGSFASYLHVCGVLEDLDAMSGKHHI
jgi:hypothetical protein